MKASRDVLREALGKRIDHLIRLGQPFSSGDMYDQRVREVMGTYEMGDVPEYQRIGNDLAASVDRDAKHLFYEVLTKKKYAKKIWRRWDRATEKFERKGKGPGSALMYYPSNDRERWHLKEQEVFLPHTVKPTTKKGKKEAEPPVRITKPEPPPKPVSQPVISSRVPIDTARNIAGLAQTLASMCESVAHLATDLALMLESIERGRDA